MSQPLPPALTKRGITSIKSNLQPGQSLDIGRAFVLIFRAELEARLLKPVARNNEKSPS